MKGYERRYVIGVALQGEEVGKAGPALSAEEVDVLYVKGEGSHVQRLCWLLAHLQTRTHVAHAPRLG